MLESSQLSFEYGLNSLDDYSPFHFSYSLTVGLNVKCSSMLSINCF